MNAKRRIKICYIVSLIVVILNFFMFALDYYDDVSTTWKVIDGIYFVCSIISLIGFTIFNFKPLGFAVKHKKWFVAIVCISCVSSLILGYIALIASFDLNHVKTKMQSTTIETTGEVMPTIDEIVKKIKELDQLKEQDLITEEEYNKRKQEILDTIVKK